MIVKIQARPGGRVLLDKLDGSYEVECPMPEDVNTALAGRPEAYFEIDLIFENFGFSLGREVGERS
jgi:hypothetical protein